MNKTAKKTAVSTIFLIISIIIFSSQILALNIESVQITNSNVTTTSNIICEFNITGTGNLDANYTWYNSSAIALQGTKTDVLSGEAASVTLPSTYTRKGETWKCGIIGINQTASTAQTNSSAVTINNSLPVITFPIAEQAVYEDMTFQITATATDADGDAIERWLSDDLNSSLYPNDGLQDIINRNTGVITILVDYDQIGNHTISLFARDNSEWGGRDVVFEVLPTNDAPVFSNLADQDATQGEIFSYTLSATDQDNTTLNFTYYSDNSNILMAANTNTSVNFAFSGGTPEYADRGNWTVYVNVSDGINTTQGSFVIEVTSVNVPPVLEFIPMYNLSQGENLVFYINASDLDDEDTLNFSVNNSLYSLTVLNSSNENATAIINISPTNNSHVIYRNITITVTDGEDSDFQIVFINITNINDAPIIYTESYNQNNTPQNVDTGLNVYTYNLTAYAYTVFRYYINATDPDIETYQGDSILFSSSDPDFPINISTGEINFTKNESWIGNHSVNITVADLAGLNTSITINITIENNTLPYFLHILPTLNCSEDVACIFDINATDDDGDNLTYSINTSFALINSTTGFISFTPNQSLIGNYSIKITVLDQKGAPLYGYFNLTINNTNDAPVFSTINLPSMVEGHRFTYIVSAEDEDLSLPSYLQYDSLSYYAFNYTNISVFNISISGLINFTPDSSHVGNHTYNFTVNDSMGAFDSVLVNFTVYPRSDPPNITQIYPYGTPVSQSIVYAWRNKSSFPNNITILNNVTENKTITFNHTSVDDKTAMENLTFEWYLDGTKLNSSSLGTGNKSMTKYFDFFSAGTHIARVVVFDDMYENSSFNWTINITNVNRPPKLYNQPANLTIDQTTTIPYYFSDDYDTIIIDPDDDINSNGQLDRGAGNNETNTLNYSITGCTSNADLEIINTDTLRVVPQLIGYCFAQVTVTDQYGLTVQSDFILINITNVPEQEEVTITSGGGGSSTETVVVPIPEEVEVPFPLEIVIPNVITIYDNETISIPIRIKNNWDETLYGITLDALFNTSANISYQFVQSFFPEISPLGTIDTSVTFWNYRLGENFEVNIVANVTQPEYNDSATVLINSLEQRSKGEQVQIKVTYARDLLDNNPECQELNEILGQAVGEMGKKNYAKAEELVDAVIQGCKYLIQKQKEKESNTETPKDWRTFFLFGNEYPTVALIAIGLILIVLISIGVFSRIKKEKRERPEGKKIEY